MGIILCYLGIEDLKERATLRERMFKSPEKDFTKDGVVGFEDVAFILLGASFGTIIVILLMLLGGLIYLSIKR